MKKQKFKNKQWSPKECDGKWNFFNDENEGEYLSDIWYDCAADFWEGFARVQLNNKWNFLNTKDKLISDTWFDWAWDFTDGRALVKLNGEQFYIDKQGKRIL